MPAALTATTAPPAARIAAPPLAGRSARFAARFAARVVHRSPHPAVRTPARPGPPPVVDRHRASAPVTELELRCAGATDTR
ncbi:hypothetical protein ACWDDN_00255 [Streptomyces griseoruber]|uniref:hypothetical protein n=1 Tax=Streptomyces griseoruber TaxID=1943 RepID=UPI00378F4D4A